jgi:hypothetical protein
MPPSVREWRVPEPGLPYPSQTVSHGDDFEKEEEVEIKYGDGRPKSQLFLPRDTVWRYPWDKEGGEGQVGWLMPVILATWEAEIRRIEIQGQLDK